MNIFPHSGEFRTHLLAGPWFAIPAQNVGPGQQPSPFFLKQLGAVNDGVGCIVTDLCDCFVGYLSLAQMKSQLAHNLPGVSVDPIEALRVVQRAVNAGTAQIVFATPLPVRAENAFPVSRGKVVFQSTLDIGLEGSRSMPLSIRLELNIFEVSTIEAVEGAPAPHGCLTTRAHNVSSNFVRDVIIIPLTQTLMSVSLLAGGYRAELSKLGHPVAAHSELESIKLLGGPPFGLQLAASDVTVTQDPLARSSAEASAAILATAAVKKPPATDGSRSATSSSTAPAIAAAPAPSSAAPPKATPAPNANGVDSRAERKAGTKTARSDDVVDESPPKRKSSLMETPEERQARLKLQEQIAAQASKKAAVAPASAPSHKAAPSTSATAGKVDTSKEDKLKKIRKVLL
jgi:hypothetical protein